MSKAHAVMRVAIVAALFILSPPCFSKPTENLETYRDQINKSQILLLQHQRLEATQVLVQAIRKEGSKSVAMPELLRALGKAADLFFSEKAQQSYEMAIASFPNNRSTTLEKLNETLKLEPLNGLILRSLAFTALSLRECGPAQKSAAQLQTINPYDPQIDKLQILVSVCLKNRNEGLLALQKLDPLSVPNLFVLINKQRLLIEEFTYAGSEPLFVENPEGFYLSWLLEKNPKRKKSFAEKYKNNCQVAPSFDKSLLWLDPWLCDHQKEILEYLAKGEKSE